GGSSAMPHKRNPVASMVALAAAHRAPQRVAALLAAMPQEHERALGAWQAELAEWPQLLMSAHGSVRALAAALPGLQIDAARMRGNIERLRAELPAEAAEEWFDPAMAGAASTIALAQVDALQDQLNQGNNAR
ncbi:MAG TPA: 3-carboxy-cis,cis-muconate cycloisomerase, partial [Variovorax sp.]|nr:3-carboxy-cis,cis-muconate cycloisomerase [Variovorax sp.]